jgi:hypothetical protein
MNILSRDKQIDIIASLCEGVGIRATARLTNTNRKTVGRQIAHTRRGPPHGGELRQVAGDTSRTEILVFTGSLRSNGERTTFSSSSSAQIACRLQSADAQPPWIGRTQLNGHTPGLTGFFCFVKVFITIVKLRLSIEGANCGATVPLDEHRLRALIGRHVNRQSFPIPLAALLGLFGFPKAARQPSESRRIAYDAVPTDI